MSVWFFTCLLTAQADPLPSIPFETYKLENGLNVILSEDHSIPSVQVNIWYGVGSKDETTGLTGFAHLFEHLMFQGSENYNMDYFNALEEIGASVNGTTSFDRTNYYEGVPSNHLPLALWIESDRMGWLLPALTEEKLQNQKEVVRNERRQSYEIRPFGRVWMWLFENLYPQGHPYHVPTIGKHEDIANAQMDDVTAFFKKWYQPSNASLVICGDFNPSQAKELVQKYFAEIPNNNTPTPLMSMEPVVLKENKIVRKTDKVPYSKVWIAWLSPPLFAPGDAEMDILSTLLSEGKDSRLHKALIEEKGLAKDVAAYQYSTQLQSQYMIEATVATGKTSDEVVSAIEEVLKEFSASEEEVRVAKYNWEARFYQNLTTIARKSDMLNNYYMRTGDAGYIQKDLQRYLDVSADSIDQTFQKVILNSKRVYLHVTPEPKEAQ
ncbi:MAG: pitrilysin family protein [Myxococcota bacterium]|nr:pitrilysin family protein [Myxococcota bacterium]